MHSFCYVTSVEGSKITDITGKEVEITFQSFQEEESDGLSRFVGR
jgi:hypothetical protein